MPAKCRNPTERRQYGVVPLTDAIAQDQQLLADAFAKIKLIPRPVQVKDAFLDLGKIQAEVTNKTDGLSKAQARLLNEGLPAFRQELSGAKGRRIRVRVGPYGTRAQADAAAASIRAMALEAVVFKQ